MQAHEGSNPSLSAILIATPFAQIAQLVEQWIEAPRVGSSTLSLGTMSFKSKPSYIGWFFLLIIKGLRMT